jgi:hypothetical protein
MKKLSELKCKSEELTEAEQFAAAVADIKRLVPRLRSLAFREHYAEIISEVKPVRIGRVSYVIHGARSCIICDIWYEVVYHI